jgi:hypothetical protein
MVAFWLAARTDALFPSPDQLFAVGPKDAAQSSERGEQDLGCARYRVRRVAVNRAAAYAKGVQVHAQHFDR